MRIAFLIEDGEHANLALDGIFADCYNRWGGRFSLIAPCVNGRIASTYWPWLEAFDPDIVYSYVPLSRADILEVHERLSPAEYAFHKLDREPRLDVFGFKPSHKFAPLSSLSAIFRLARYSPAPGEGAPVKIIDSWLTERPSRLLTDNFGTYHLSRGGGIYPPDAAAAASLLTIVSPEMQADPRYGVPRDLNAIPSEMAAFREFAEGRATSLSLASTLFAPKLDIRADRWSGIVQSCHRRRLRRPHPFLECASPDPRLAQYGSSLLARRIGAAQRTRVLGRPRRPARIAAIASMPALVVSRSSQLDLHPLVRNNSQKLTSSYCRQIRGV